MANQADIRLIVLSGKGDWADRQGLNCHVASGMTTLSNRFFHYLLCTLEFFQYRLLPSKVSNKFLSILQSGNTSTAKIFSPHLNHTFTISLKPFPNPAA